ncbi:MAG: PfaD family polyunsaturated fatty acid/polyketide biosynthesis protein [Myxococcota bacterium]|nr:PfaD family polyunsaturated fatty acid/polyketide biosynthesis protein [Myxococcota bacterium]
MITDLEAVLRPYQPAQAVVYYNDKIIQRYEGHSGGLADAIDMYGLQPLFGVLKDRIKLELNDEGHTILLFRSNNQIEIHTYIENQPPAVAHIPISEDSQTAAPQSKSPVKSRDLSDEKPKALPPALGQIALWDPSRTLYLQAGQIYDQSIARPDFVLPSRTFRDLGAAFCQVHQVKAPYVAGAMAGGIASTALVRAMSQAGMLAFFGTGGLEVKTIEQAILELQDLSTPYGFNLLSNPNEPAIEDQTVSLFLKHKITRVSASAYVRLSLPLVRYRVHGIQLVQGKIFCPNQVFAKCSHPSVARRFMEPPPSKMLQRLVALGHINDAQAELAAQIPMAEDVTIEADSGGHTDRRPFPVLLPTMHRIREEVTQAHGYERTIRLGAAGGIGDPYSLLAAFDMGADYVLTGSINQSSIEAGTSEPVKALLCKAGIADCAMGAAPDMFEMGAHVQVLGRGSMYAQRSNKLRSLYQRYSRWSDVPEAERLKIEKTVFQKNYDELWNQTKAYWQNRDPRQVERAETDLKHQMALCFRWYLGMSSRWARLGDTDRAKDYQIWCGPSMGAFNAWVKGSWLEPQSIRRVDVMAKCLLHGALTLQRLKLARQYGIEVPFAVQPDKSHHS